MRNQTFASTVPVCAAQAQSCPKHERWHMTCNAILSTRTYSSGLGQENQPLILGLTLQPKPPQSQTAYPSNTHRAKNSPSKLASSLAVAQARDSGNHSP